MHLQALNNFLLFHDRKSGEKTGFTLSEPDDVMAVFTWFTDALKERTGLSDSKLFSLLVSARK